MVADGPDIWVMRADGSHEHALTSNPASDDYPSFSPNGKRIAFDSERSGNVDIYVMRADGTDEHALTTGGRDEHDPNYSPGRQADHVLQAAPARTTTCSRWTPTAPTSAG